MSDEIILTEGQRLTRKYVATIPEPLYAQYRGYANKLISAAVAEIDKAISNGGAPVAALKLSENSKHGISKTKLEELLNDYRFFFVLQREARAKSLCIDLDRQPISDDISLGKIEMQPLLVCTISELGDTI